MKVAVNRAFFDLKEQVDRKQGDEFEATKARVDEIVEALGEGWITVVPAKRQTKSKTKESEE